MTRSLVSSAVRASFVGSPSTVRPPGALTTAILHLEPGGTIRPHTHLIEEAMTLLEGRLLILVGDETAEIEGGTSWLAPANTVHGARNVGQSQAVMVIAYPGVEVAAFPVEREF